MKNFDTCGQLTDVVENSMLAKDDFAQWTLRIAWIGGANKGEGCQNADMFKDAPSEANCGLWVIAGDVRTNVLDVGNRRIGPDYFEVHAVAQDSTERSASC